MKTLETDSGNIILCVWLDWFQQPAPWPQREVCHLPDQCYLVTSSRPCCQWTQAQTESSVTSDKSHAGLEETSQIKPPRATGHHEHTIPQTTDYSGHHDNRPGCMMYTNIEWKQAKINKILLPFPPLRAFVEYLYVPLSCRTETISDGMVMIL